MYRICVEREGMLWAIAHASTREKAEEFMKCDFIFGQSEKDIFRVKDMFIYEDSEYYKHRRKNAIHLSKDELRILQEMPF